MEEEILSTIEGVEKVIKDREYSPIFWQGEQDTLVLLGSNSGTRGRGESSGGGRGIDEPIDLELEPSYSEREEEDEGEEEMAVPNVEWMTQGPLALLTILYKMPK